MSADTAIYIEAGDKGRAVRGGREGLPVCVQGSTLDNTNTFQTLSSSLSIDLNADTSFICLLIEDLKNVDGSSVK